MQENPVVLQRPRFSQRHDGKSHHRGETPTPVPHLQHVAPLNSITLRSKRNYGKVQNRFCSTAKVKVSQHLSYVCRQNRPRPRAWWKCPGAWARSRGGNRPGSRARRSITLCVSLLSLFQRHGLSSFVSNNSEFSLTMCRTRLPDTCYRVSSSPVGVLSNFLVAVDLFEVRWFEVRWAFRKHQRCSSF